MKKIFISLFAAAALIGCSQTESNTSASTEAAASSSEIKVPSTVANKPKTPEQEFKAHINDLNKKMKRRNANKDSLMVEYENYLRESSLKYMGDTLGLMITRSMAVDFNKKQLDSVMNICDLYRNDPELQQMAKAAVAAEATAVGKRYVDIKGLNVKNDKKTLTLSSVVAQGKPVLVNFWNTKSIPSRDVIRNNMLDLQKQFGSKVNFCSVAVLEDSITFVHRATEDLMYDWPSIYTEGTDKSPVDVYGAHGVPFIMLIGRDGIIKARNIKADDLKEVLEKELGK